MDAPLYVPGVHGEQMPLPSLAALCPAVQATHAAESVAPVILDALPRAQSAQYVAPALYLPTPHDSHPVLADAEVMVPGLQSVHADAWARSAYLPATHAVHDVAATAPSVEYPAPQPVQAVEPEFGW